MPNLTPNYSFNLPLVNNATDADLWGGQLNSNWSSIDTLLKSETQLPVGSIYMNYSDSTNPGTLLGYGTWVAITDRFVVARGATYTSTGGAATVTLTTSELPAHTHSTGAAYVAGGGSTPNVWSNGGASNSTVTTGSAGSGAAFSIIPPYQAVYMWYRSV